MKIKRLLSVALSITLTCFLIAGCQPEQTIPQQQTESVADVEAPREPVETAQVQVEENQDQTVSEGKTPKIVVTKKLHDFGEVGPASSNLANYEFVNSGQGVLTVRNIQSTCGCSKPTLIKDGQRYPAPLKEPVLFEPGQKGQVEVTFKAPSTKGPVSKNLYILCDDTKSPRAPLVVKAQVVVKIEVRPEKVDLRLDVENAGMPDLIVKSTDGREFSILSINISRDVMSIPFDSKEKATEFTLKPTVDIDKLAQVNSGVFQIKTSHPQASILLVRYNAKPLFEVSNPRFILQNVEPDQAIVRENLIRSNYGKPAEIESVKSRNGYMEIVDQVPDGDHLKLSIKITPPSQQSSTRRYITDELTVTLKGGYKLSIRCSGWFRLNN